MRVPVRQWGRVALIALAATALGAVLAVVKGRGDGLGHLVGNLSMPYLLAAFFAAARSDGGERRAPSACWPPGRRSQGLTSRAVRDRRNARILA